MNSDERNRLEIELRQAINTTVDEEAALPIHEALEALLMFDFRTRRELEEEVFCLRRQQGERIVQEVTPRRAVPGKP
jgi:hypothetical protein